MRRTSFTSAGFAHILVAALLAGGVAEAGEGERYAHRFTPVSIGWTTESKIKPGSWEIWELSRFQAGVSPTSEQRRAADDLIARTRAAVLRNGWDDFAKAKADGFRHMPVEDPHHYHNPNYLFDDRVLDPERPEFLMYYGLEGKPQLTGAMFLVRSHQEEGPQVGGPLTVWHIHTWKDPQCVFKEVMPLGVGPSADGQCAKGVSTSGSVEMLHVWLIDRPKGPFSTSMIVPKDELKAALAKRLAEEGY